MLDKVIGMELEGKEVRPTCVIGRVELLPLEHCVGFPLKRKG